MTTRPVSRTLGSINNLVSRTPGIVLVSTIRCPEHQVVFNSAKELLSSVWDTGKLILNTKKLAIKFETALGYTSTGDQEELFDISKTDAKNLVILPFKEAIALF